MSNQFTRTLTRIFVAMTFVMAISIAAVAQTPSPTPVNPATQPPGTEVPPATVPPGAQVSPTPLV